MLTSLERLDTFLDVAARKPQLELLKKNKDAYGGTLRCTREGRSGPRPISTRETMHLVLRSTKATGEWSFKKPKNEKKIREIVARFSQKYGVRMISIGFVGNHIHFQLKLGNRFAFKPFIRGLTSSIAMAVTGVSRWTRVKGIGGPAKNQGTTKTGERFWDYRPFTRVVRGFRALLNLKDYIKVNELEGFGCNRLEARIIVEDEKLRPWLYLPVSQDDINDAITSD
jgi:putative transposase